MSKCFSAKLIEWAWDQVGYHEKTSNSQLEDKTANSGSNNWTKYADYIDKNFPNFFNGKKNGYDWCDTFVDCGFLQCYGYENALRLLCQPEKSYGAGCEYSLGYYKARGQFFTSGPVVGDQIFFGGGIHDVQHTGIVVGVNSFDKTVTTVEGNTGNMVASHTYPMSAYNIVGYGRPAYDAYDPKDDIDPEELAERVKALEERVGKLRDALDIHMVDTAPKVFHTSAKLPSYAEWTKVLIQAGSIRGKAVDDLALTEDMVRIVEFLGRMGVFDGVKGVG